MMTYAIFTMDDENKHTGMIKHDRISILHKESLSLIV